MSTLEKKEQQIKKLKAAPKSKSIQKDQTNIEKENVFSSSNQVSKQK